VDPLFSTVEYTMGALQLRTETIAHNIANVETPNYRSRRVDFEEDLLRALTGDRPTPGRPAHVEAGFDLPDKNGNSVSLEVELTDMAKTALERQTMVSGFNYKLTMFRTAAGGR
jgi:flagellar basal-body rod protein FlgB